MTKLEIKTDEMGNIKEVNFPEMIGEGNIDNIISKIEVDNRLTEKEKIKALREWKEAKAHIKKNDLQWLCKRYKTTIKRF